MTVSDIRVFLICPRRLYYMNSASALRKIRDARAASLKKNHSKAGFSEIQISGGDFSSAWFFASDPFRKYEIDILRETLAEIPYRMNGARLPDETARMRLISDVISDVCGDFGFSENGRGKYDNGEMHNNDEKYYKEEPNNNDRECENDEKYDNDENLANRLNEAVSVIAANLEKTYQAFGENIFEALSSPVRTDCLSFLDVCAGISLSGVISKILPVRINEVPCLIPYIIRISPAPDSGVWASDRVCAAAYLMLLEKRDTPPDRFETSAESSAVRAGPLVLIDYSGDIRYAVIHSIDRKRVFRAVRHIRRLKSGEMPDTRRGKWCQSCAFQEMCRPKEKTLLSIFRGKL